MQGYRQTFTDLRALVILAVASEGNVGSRVYAEGGTPNNEPAPYIVIRNQNESDERYRDHESTDTAEDLEVEIAIHTEDRNQLLTLADLVRTYFKGSMTQGSTTFGSIHFEGDFYSFIKDLKMHIQEIELKLQITN